MQLIGFLLFFGMGVVQFFAIVDGMGGGIFGFAAALILAYIPLVGSIAGVYGAMSAWGWEFVPTFLLFFWYLPIVVLAATASGLRRS